MSLVLSSDAKPRLRWTQELHQRFVDSVIQLGGPEKATLKSLMRVMGINGLTLYHLKSHLQNIDSEKSQQSQTYQQNKQEDDGENQTSQSTDKISIGAHEEINVKLCGHATLAASHFLFTFDLVKSNTIEFMTLSGILTAKRVPDSSNGNASDSFLIELNFPIDPLMEYNGAADVSTDSKSLNGASVKEILKTTGNDLLVVLPSVEAVVETEPNFDEIQKFPGRGMTLKV
ncbi:hypothetical protein CASFOL_031775 [Castilleja foliolosa]|uniref:HTH myb-type domain-containing protein n=1 Tax=Castilleja foliolosa TaxID=1961234 RepID=A0ABD3C6B1_9LAMI